MFEVKIDVALKLDGCPESGLAAIDWRRQNKLPEAPTNVVRLQWEGQSEAFCRRFRDLLDGESNLTVITNKDTYSQFSLSWKNSAANQWVANDPWDNKSLSYSTVSADLARQFATATPPESAAVELVQRLIDQAAATRAEREARKAREAAEEAARKAEVERDNREREAAKAAEKAEVDAWIDAHGSRRLKRCKAENVDCIAAYRDERLAMDRPGWIWDTADVPGSGKEPRNPPESAFDLLDEARKTDPAARLVFWVAEESVDEEGDEIPEWRGYAAMSEFLGRDIVYGLPAELIGE